MNPSLKIILASASLRRHSFLEMLQLPFTVHTADIDETPLPKESPSQLVYRLSQEKAQAVAAHYQNEDCLIIAADTIVVHNNQILGKPTDEDDARTMLTQLRNEAHFVYTAVSLLHSQTQELTTVLNKSTVSMRDYSRSEMTAYIASGDPLDKAGAYAIQNEDFAPVAHISGCYAGIMGLPLGDLALALAKYDIAIDNLGAQCSAFIKYRCCQENPS